MGLGTQPQQFNALITQIATLIYICFINALHHKVLKVCRTPGPKTCLKTLNKVCLKSSRKEKCSMTELRQP